MLIVVIIFILVWCFFITIAGAESEDRIDELREALKHQGETIGMLIDDRKPIALDGKKTDTEILTKALEGICSHVDRDYIDTSK